MIPGLEEMGSGAHGARQIAGIGWVHVHMQGEIAAKPASRIVIPFSAVFPIGWRPVVTPIDFRPGCYLEISVAAIGNFFPGQEHSPFLLNSACIYVA